MVTFKEYRKRHNDLWRCRWVDRNRQSVCEWRKNRRHNGWTAGSCVLFYGKTLGKKERKTRICQVGFEQPLYRIFGLPWFDEQWKAHEKMAGANDLYRTAKGRRSTWIVSCKKGNSRMFQYFWQYKRNGKSRPLHIWREIRRNWNYIYASEREKRNSSAEWDERRISEYAQHGCGYCVQNGTFESSIAW